MKTVVVCAAQAPFVRGGAEILVEELRANLVRRGFRVEVVGLPFHGYPPSELVRQALAWRLLELKEGTGEPVDLVIPTKFPSYLVRHPRKVTWLFHQHREAYDLHGSAFCSLGDSPDDEEVRQAIRSMDEAALTECRDVFAISRNVADRLSRFNGLRARPLYPPPQQVGRYRTEAYGDFLLYAGRLERLKRLDLALEALRRTRQPVRLKIAGTGPLRADLERQAERAGLGDRVEFLGFVPVDELLSLYARCRGAYYAPLDEDYGYVTVEAFLSRKPVVTSTDAGGPLEFVTHERSGLVAAPEPEAMAEALDHLWAAPPARLAEMGEEGHARVRDIHWDAVVDALTECLR